MIEKKDWAYLKEVYMLIETLVAILVIKEFAKRNVMKRLLILAKQGYKTVVAAAKTAVEEVEDKE